EVAPRHRRRPLLCLPGLEEELLQLGDDGPFDEQVGVAPRQRLLLDAARADARSPGAAAARAARIDAADVDAAEHRARAVDDEELAVVAVVHLPARLGGERV